MFDRSNGADPKLWKGGYDWLSQRLPCSFLAVRMMQPVGSPTRHSAIVAGFVFGRDGLCRTSLWLNTCTENACNVGAIVEIVKGGPSTHCIQFDIVVC